MTAASDYIHAKRKKFNTDEMDAVDFIADERLTYEKDMRPYTEDQDTEMIEWIREYDFDGR